MGHHDVRWLDDRQQKAWRLFLAATRHLEAKLDRQLQLDAGVPHAYYQILAMLSEAPELIMRMSELAKLVDASPSRLSHSMSRLEERGWVERQRCDGDARGIHARLTPEGLSAILDIAPGHVTAVRESLFDRLTPEQVEQLASIASAMLDSDE